MPVRPAQLGVCTTFVPQWFRPLLTADVRLWPLLKARLRHGLAPTAWGSEQHVVSPTQGTVEQARSPQVLPHCQAVMIVFARVRPGSVSHLMCAFEQWRPSARDRERRQLQPELQPRRTGADPQPSQAARGTAASGRVLEAALGTVANYSPRPIPGSASGRPRTTSSWPTCPSTAPG
jgi:hypothetical protein